MIVKGSPRKDGPAMAVYFMTSEPGARLIFSTDPMGDTLAAMTEWDEIGRLTRGEKPLYHMQLCPDAKYVVTDAQWKRMAEIVLEELGAVGHDYELYFHPGVKDDGKPDKPHAHLGICRTNRDTLTMWDDGYSFNKHERASLRIAKEFGWEIVPGKHAKRDRKKQPEFPRAETTQADHQQEKRTGLTLAERKAQIAQLYGQSSTGLSFKNALESAGYILAQGERGYLVVDAAGGHSVLTRNVKGLQKDEAERFLRDVPLDKLPTLDEAKALQKQRAAEAIREVPERSKFLPAEQPTKAAEAPAAPPPSKFLPEKPAPTYDPSAYAPKARTPETELPSKFLPPPAPVSGPTPAPEQPKSAYDPAAYAPKARTPETELPSKFMQPPAPPQPEPPLEQAYDPAADAPEAPAAPEQKRIPLPSDPWMAQIGGVDKLSPDHLASAQRSYEAWRLKGKYDFRDYVSYVQSQWEDRKPAPWLPPAPKPKKPAYDTTTYAPKPADWKEQDLTPQFNAEQPAAAPPPPKPAEDPEILRLRYVLFKLRQGEYQKFAEANAAAYRAREIELTNATVWKMEDFEQRQREAMEAFRHRQQPKRKGIKGLLDKIGDKLNPEAAEEKHAEKKEERELFRARQARERRDFIAQLDADKKTQLEALRARQLQEQAAREKTYNEEIERRVRETLKAREIAREIEADEKARKESGWAEDFKKEKEYPWDDEPPEKGK